MCKEWEACYTINPAKGLKLLWWQIKLFVYSECNGLLSSHGLYTTSHWIHSEAATPLATWTAALSGVNRLRRVSSHDDTAGFFSHPGLLNHKHTDSPCQEADSINQGFYSWLGALQSWLLLLLCLFLHRKTVESIFLNEIFCRWPPGKVAYLKFWRKTNKLKCLSSNYLTKLSIQ